MVVFDSGASQVNDVPVDPQCGGLCSVWTQSRPYRAGRRGGPNHFSISHSLSSPELDEDVGLTILAFHIVLACLSWR
ncbi:hypothetical protein DPMN_001075 [Dreissena polymorpha]|uniref:Uncharacterized protein n=1 Tax=Dreissena polymorpha TaxID=45954 RepID=A0A9D4RQJ5_DREPO|nr:hypothetical protein DPMN_001075 [Dreissena polymorpha]